MKLNGSATYMGKIDTSNGAVGKSDIEGKAAREAASALGKERVSKWAGAHESTWAANEFSIDSLLAAWLAP